MQSQNKYETNSEVKCEFFLELYVNNLSFLLQLYNLGTKDKPTPVTGLEFDKMTLKSMNEKKYFIMATTARYVH
jgi:hypothetical protein